MNMNAAPPSVLDQLQMLVDQLKRWEPQITEALHDNNNTHTLQDIVRMILENKLLFFGFDECFAIMELVVYPQFTVFHGFICGGDMDALIASEERLMDVGRTLGCRYLTIAGRKGWSRVLDKHGWKHVCSSMYKPIEAENEQG